MLSLRQMLVVGAFVGGAACGLRTDPGSGPGACIDNDTDGTPRAGSCQNPFPVTYQDGERFQGNIDGCSEGSSWCGGAGGEDYYLYKPNRGDVKITFNPVDGGVEPILRVVKVPADTSPCGNDIPAEDTNICTAITNDDPSWNFYAGGAEFDYYIVVDSAGGTGPYEMQLNYGIEALGNECQDKIPVEPEVIRLGRNGVYEWEATLQGNKQGRLDGKCGGGGDEDLFIVRMIEGGTLHVAVEALSGGFTPVVGISRGPGCAGESGIRCEQALGGYAETEISSSAATTRFIVVDQTGVTGGNYRMTAWMD